MKGVLIGMVLAGFCTCLWGRTWTDVNGRKIEAEFKSYDATAGLLTIVKDGKAFELPLKQLCEADIAYVKEQIAGGVQKLDVGAEKKTPIPKDQRDATKRYATLATFFANASKNVRKVSLDKDERGHAMIHTLDVQGTQWKYEDRYYTGFRFEAPTWVDGDFHWFFLLDKKKDRKDFQSGRLEWFLVTDGTSKRHSKHETKLLKGFRELRKQYPNTGSLATHRTQSLLEGGKEYAIWFGYPKETMVDIAFSLGIDSKRGKKELGELLTD